jgi:hypothetical protein
MFDLGRLAKKNLGLVQKLLKTREGRGLINNILKITFFLFSF